MKFYQEGTGYLHRAGGRICQPFRSVPRTKNQHKTELSLI
jgi:hypothetical protein